MKKRNMEPKTEEQRIRARTRKEATTNLTLTLYVSALHGEERVSKKPGSNESQSRKIKKMQLRDGKYNIRIKKYINAGIKR